MNTHWNATLQHLSEKGRACALVTIFSTKGSTPRKNGSKMLVTADKTYYSIGGGHLEHQATKLARDMLNRGSDQAFIKSFSLGASLGQCCGGQIELLFEAFYPAQHNIVIFGAGHIAKALIPILAQLPCHIQWIDQRADLFTDTTPDNLQIIVSDDTQEVLNKLRANSYIIIMTHNHQLDQELCEGLLRAQADLNRSAPLFHFLGLIGSSTKWKKFKLRLEQKGFCDEQIASIHCPIGLKTVQGAETANGKSPIEIAVSVAAHFIQSYQTLEIARQAERENNQLEIAGECQKDNKTP